MREPVEESKDNGEDVVDEVVKDNLEVMLEIIMIIRTDALFAQNIYANCPRLQNLLSSHPDLRPVFEDPSLVKINFEEVYKKAGGILPEDQPSWYATTLNYIVKHPLFKVFRFLLLIKKCYSCFVGGGMAFFRTMLCSLCGETAAAGGAADGLLAGESADNNRHRLDGDQGSGNPEYEANQGALNNAADYMEDPAVQERVQTILNSDPDKIDELISADPELSALRDSNRLCAELMSSPETMKILVEPDNLRALGEAPGLIEQDFANPDWTPPDVEQGQYDDGGVARSINNNMPQFHQPTMSAPDETTGLLDGYEPGAVHSLEERGLFDGYEPEVPSGEGGEGIEVLDGYEPGEVDGHHSGPLDGFEEGDTLEEGGDAIIEDFEPAAPEEVAPESEEIAIEETEAADKKGTGAGAKGAANKNRSREADRPDQSAVGGATGLLRSLGAGLVDYVAAETIGTTTTELIGNDGDFLATAEQEMLGGAEDEAADGAEDDAVAENAAIVGDLATGDEVDDMAGNLEDTMDTAEEAKDRHGDATAPATTGRSSVPSTHLDLDQAVEDYAAESAAKDSPAAPGGIFGLGASFFAALKTEAKEYVATTILGDDLGELAVERMEEGGDEEGDAENGGKPKPAGAAAANFSSTTIPASRSTSSHEF